MTQAAEAGAADWSSNTSREATGERSGSPRPWLTGTTAFITGGASGLGRAVAERFLDEGAKVAVFDRNASKLADFAATHDSATALTIAGDVRSSADLHDAVTRTVQRFGRLDTVVPNAGLWDFHRSVTRLSGPELADTFDEVFAVNVKGYLLTVEASWRELVATHGSVVMTLSNAAFHPAGGGPVYTASKFASRGLVTQLAYELAPKVRVNAVAVGGLNTDLRGPDAIGLQDRSIGDSFQRSSLTGNNPLIPLHDSSVEPADFTGPYVLLASAANAGAITGHIIEADGGISVRGFGDRAAGGDSL